MFPWRQSKEMSSEERRIIRAHWEWAARYALLWIIVSVLIFSGILFMFDYLDVDESVRTPSLVLLATITIVNTIWRAAGVLAARIELMLSARQDHEKP
jgi:membrane-anchored glycerophosphoryl diester phosphodiesterase (GDPDase)